MLFSDDTVAKLINDRFEPAWQSVRPVPTVRIDFGDGRVVTRTLHGNIATYVCRPDGRVLDVLPGVYDPVGYAAQLDQMLKLFEYVEQSSVEQSAVLADYHRRQAKSLAEHGMRETLKRMPLGVSISGRELGVRIVLQPAERLHARGRMARGRPPIGDHLRDASRFSRPDLLEQDTRINETVRRPLVHRYLAEHPDVTPEQITNWLYREVLKADLDDPYLGLGSLLFDSQAELREGA